MTTSNREGDYLLGTGDDEIDRLALQHRVWRPRAQDAWRRAGFTLGQTLLDIGCGPGHAAVDLAEIAGPSGRVFAIDRSKRFLDALEATRLELGLSHLETHEVDLDQGALPQVGADGAWCRWVLAFLKRPHDLLVRITSALRPGGVLVLHEYFAYSTWRLAPRSVEFEEFVRVVMQSWRADGGEPDIALDLPVWLGELGFKIKELRPIVDIVPASDLIWQWPKSFFQSGLRRLVDLGHVTADRARSMMQAFAACEASPHSLMITPAVLEIIAVRN
jgi:SAM-dependent methyltransferase